MSIFVKQTKADERKTPEVFDDELSYVSSRSPLPGEMPAPPRDKRQRSIVQSDLVITGNLSTTGILDFAGRITGDVSSDTLLIGADGQITGQIRTKHLTTTGEITGNLFAEDVTLKSKSLTNANIQCERISVEAGAVIDGNLQCQPNRKS